MAIVKLQNGKVLLKDGKVSCSCCAPVACCMYPAQAFYDGLYSAADLPDAIELECEAGTYVLSKSGSTFTDGTIVVDNWFNPFYGYAIWRVYHPVPPFLGCGSEIGQCLITDPAKQGYYSRDQFADVYTITYDSDITCESVSSIVTRESLCVWRGIADDGSTITLEIEFGSFSNLYAWTTNAPNCGGNKRGIGMPFDRYNNLGRLNTPLGNYEDEITPGSIIHTVS